MNITKITFDYEPDEPDDSVLCGMSQEEFDTLMERLMELGATNVDMVRQP